MYTENLSEANKYLFGTENTHELNELFEYQRDFDEDIIEGEPFYRYFPIWAKQLQKDLMKFNEISLLRFMKSRRIKTGMDLVLRMYAEIITENNPWQAKYADIITTDYLGDIEESITKYCKKGLIHLCKLFGLEASIDPQDNLQLIYSYQRLNESVLMEASMYYFGDYVPLLEKMSERKVSARNEKIVKEYHDKVAKIDTQTDLTLKRMRRERDTKADKAKDPEQKKRIRETYDKKIDMVEKMAKNKKDAAAHEKEIKLEKLSADSEKSIWTKEGREARKDSKVWSKLEKSMKD